MSPTNACTCIYFIIIIYYMFSLVLQLPNDGSPLNKEWIQKRLEASMSEKSKIFADKKMFNNKVLKNKASCLKNYYFYDI